MWIVLAREAEPDAAYWPGRRGLAALDAVLWPLLWLAGTASVMPSLGLVGPIIIVLALVSLVSRLRRAWWVNARYRFTTRRWGRGLALLVLCGVVLRICLAP